MLNQSETTSRKRKRGKRCFYVDLCVKVGFLFEELTEPKPGSKSKDLGWYAYVDCGHTLGPFSTADIAEIEMKRHFRVELHETKGKR